MRHITGCLRPTPTELLPVLSGIAPAPLCREHHTHTLVTKALTSPSHVKSSGSTMLEVTSSLLLTCRVRLVNSQFDICESWITNWQQVSLPAHLNIAPNTALPPGAELPRKEWVSLNRLRTGVFHFGLFMYRWGLRQSAACQCGAPEQTVQHPMDECPNFCPPVALNLCHHGPSTREWLRLLGDIILYLPDSFSYFFK